jgi:hypothetical protein
VEVNQQEGDEDERQVEREEVNAVRVGTTTETSSTTAKGSIFSETILGIVTVSSQTLIPNSGNSASNALLFRTRFTLSLPMIKHTSFAFISFTLLLA